MHSMHSPVSAEGGRVEPPTKYSKSGKRGVDIISFFRGGCSERKGDFSGGGYSFYIKIKLKSEISNNKKRFMNKFFFSVLTKNLNWEILTKNLVTFKRWDEVKDEKI